MCEKQTNWAAFYIQYTDESKIFQYFIEQTMWTTRKGTPATRRRRRTSRPCGSRSEELIAQGGRQYNSHLAVAYLMKGVHERCDNNILVHALTYKIMNSAQIKIGKACKDTDRLCLLHKIGCIITADRVSKNLY